MSVPPTLYKARGVPTKQAICAICIDRTRGRTELVRLGYGVTVWLCAGHASPGWQNGRSGRDFVLTLHRIWHASGCLTRSRSRALDAHLERLKGRRGRPLPGSYAWPEVRRECERRFAQGAHPTALAQEIRRRWTAHDARPPSVASIERWHRQRRWMSTGARAP